MRGDQAPGADQASCLAPVVPTAIFCIGLNYRQHAEETKAKIPEFPVLFMKSPGRGAEPGRPDRAAHAAQEHAGGLSSASWRW